MKYLFVFCIFLTSCKFQSVVLDTGDSYTLKQIYKNDFEDVVSISEDKNLYVVGVVEDEEQIKYRFNKIAKENADLKSINELFTCDNYSKKGDRLLENYVKMKILTLDGVKSRNFLIHVSCGKVYIFGKYRNNDEIFALTNMISKLDNVLKVINYAQDIKSPNE